MAVMVRALWFLCALALLVPACKSCRSDKESPPQIPAGRRELALVDQALNGAYRDAMLELEKTPEASLRAVLEQSAPLRSRKAIWLSIMADRLAHIDQYRQWGRTLDESAGRSSFGSGSSSLPGLGGPQPMPHIYSPLGPGYPERIAGLDSDEHTYFWSERLLITGGSLLDLAAVAHLLRIANPAAIDALALFVRTPGSRLGRGRAAEALGRLGRARDLAEALAAYQHPDLPPSAIPGGIGVVRGGFRTLSPFARTAGENEILAALEKEPLTSDQRAGYLAALGAFGSDRAADRLVELRQTSWGKQAKTQIDAAIAEILNRDPSDQRGSKTP